MIRSHGFFTLLLFFPLTLTITTTHYDYFKYIGPNLTTCENETFTEFYLIDHDDVLHISSESVNFNHYFPKCCPPNYKYQIIERKCVKSFFNDSSIIEMLDVEVNLIKSGLKNCEVIVDHVLLLEDLNNVLGSQGEIQYENETFALGRYCVDAIENENLDDKENDKAKNQIILRVCYDSEYCIKGRLRCLKKCCRDGEVYLGRACGAQPEHGFPIEPHKKIIVNFTDNFAIFSQRRECKLHNPNISYKNVTIFENGSIRFRGTGEWQTYNVEKEMYCFELGLSKSVTPYLLMCNNIDDRKSIKYSFSKVVMSLSCVCLIITMGVYIFLYKLKKVIHRIVFSYCIAQFTGFAVLTYVQIYPAAEPCKVLGFVVFFGFLAGFSWLTVMCFDMWRTIGSMASKVGNKSKADLKKTLYYCLYGWSVPAFLTIFCYCEHTYNLFPHAFHAYIGEYFCLLELRLKDGNYGHTIFFTLPIALLTIANIVFFILTLRYIIEATDNVRRMSDTKKEKKKALYALRKRTFMALKLFLVMGIDWFFEVISSIIDFKVYTITRYIELFFDTFNCFQGVFIFLIFVLKWKVIKSIVAKFKVIVVSTASRSTSVNSSSN